jgi:hypothetical protein
MAEGDVLLRVGDTITWGDSGQTYAMTLQNLATVAGRVGARADLTDWPNPTVYRWYLEVEWASAPTIDQVVELYFGGWDNDTGPARPQGQLPATDTGYAAGNAGLSKRKNLMPAGVVTAETAAVGPFSNGGLIALPYRYVSPFIYNGGSTALKNTANACVLRLTPIYSQVQS